MQRFLELIAPIWKPHPGQLEFLLHPSKFKVLACGRRWGKTDACAVQIVHALHRPYPTRHLLLAPTAAQASLVFDRAVQLLDTLRELALEAGQAVLKVKATPFPHLRFGPHVVMARSGQVPRSLRGNEATHIVVDEAAYIPESLVTEVAMPMLATTDGYLTLVSTPRGRNHFWRFFQMGQRGEHGIWSRTAPSSESPLVSENFLAIQKELVSERAYNVEYGAQFMDTAGQVFKSDAVQDCLVTKLPSIEGPIVVGVDWARYQDYTAVAVLQGNTDGVALLSLKRFQGLAWSSLVNNVAEVIEPYQHARVLCDATGVGDPVLEMLRARLPNNSIQGATFTSSYKSELIDRLAWMIERRVIAMTPHPELLKELEHFEAKALDSGATKLSATSGFHDDLVIALALAARQVVSVYSPQILVGPRRNFSATNKPQQNHEAL